MTVNNAAPVVDAGPDATLTEGDTFVSAGSVSDAGVLDTLTATVDYGEGAGPQPLALNPDGTFALSNLYEQDGAYLVTVSVTDDDGGVGIDTATVTVGNATLVVDAGPDAVLTEGDTFVSAGSVSGAGVLDTLTATVDYGEGAGPQTLPLNPDDTFALSNLYEQDGVYVVTVSVADDDGGVGIDTVTVTVNNAAPVVDAGPDAVLTEGDTFGSAGSFTDAGVLDTWMATVDYGEGAGAQPLALNPDGTFALSNLYEQDGIYVVTVSVADGDGGLGVDTATVTVNNAAPVVDAGPDAVLTEGDTLISSGLVTDAGVLDTLTATVDYDEGAGPQPLALNAGGTFDLSNLYENEGTYTVTVVVTDSAGDTGADTAIVIVEAGTVTVLPPSDLTARPKSTKVQLVWSHVGADSYNVYRSLVSRGPYDLHANTTSTYSTYLDEGLTNGTTYYYVVTSVVGGVESVASTEVFGTPANRRRR